MTSLVLKHGKQSIGSKAWQTVYSMLCLGRVAQSVGHLTCKSGVLGSIPGLATYFRFSFRFFKKGSCQLLTYLLSYWRKYMHEVLVNRLGGLSLSRKSVVRLTDRPDMTLDVYRGRKIMHQQQQQQKSMLCQFFSGITN